MELEIKDCKGQSLYGGCVVIGHNGHMRGTYKKKDFTDSVRVIYMVNWDKHNGGYGLKHLGIFEDDWDYKEGYYRMIESRLEVSSPVKDPKYPNVRIGGKYRDDMVCESLERVDGSIVFVKHCGEKEDVFCGMIEKK